MNDKIINSKRDIVELINSLDEKMIKLLANIALDKLDQKQKVKLIENSIKSYSTKELKDLNEKALLLIEEKKEKEVEIEKIKAKMAELGVSLSDLGS